MSAAIQVSPDRRFGRILGIGGYRPRRVVPNAEVAGAIDSSDDWIRTRSGIRSRRWAGEAEGVVDMATAAAGRALERAGLTGEQVDCVLVATMTHTSPMPSAASQVAHRIGARNPGTFDISAACAGFCYALATANDLVRSGSASTVLVIGADRMTDLLDHSDRGTAFLFSDGAGAVVVGAAAEPGIGPVSWGTDGAQGDAIRLDRSWVQWRDDLRADPSTACPTMRMRGQAVYRWATTAMTDAGQRALKAAGVTVDDLAAFVPHQANDRITGSLARSLRLPEHVVVAHDVVEQGNSSAASVPLALEALVSAGSVESGGLALLLGFGAGLSYAAQVVALP